MRRSPSIVPENGDHDICLVLNDFGDELGRAWLEADEERTDRETVIRDLLAGQYSDPVRVIAFNTVEGWSRDISADVASEAAERVAIDGCDVPPWLEGFIERHGSGRPVQLPLLGLA
jgi:hypothetical protein